MPIVWVIIAALGTLAILGWVRAWRLSHHRQSPTAASHHQTAVASIDEVQSQAAGQIATSIQQASELFQKNLTVQALKVNDELEGLARQRLRKQVEDFAAVLDSLTTTASASVAQLESLIDARRQAMEASLTTEVQDVKQRAIEQFYGRLSDMVASYIIQSLGNEVDLSSQLPFVLKVLEENKEVIKRDLLSDY